MKKVFLLFPGLRPVTLHAIITELQKSLSGLLVEASWRGHPLLYDPPHPTF
jgi:hypothetical protein